MGHIAFGFISLLFGLWVIFAAKKGTIHRTLGNIYFWAMTGVFVTSIILSTMKYNPFLFGVGVFSYYLVFIGFRFGKKMERHNWLFEHIARMLGGYITTVTAFLITAMSGMLPSMVLWLGPGVIGGIGITLTIRHYRRKLGATKSQPAAIPEVA